ncbi:AmfC protein [Egicoccus sp. AB-alg2]|uniref:RsiG family protein n=1 Tax=Egicoccus sp. AB-alg2 TaxID=3242693 RepID=UPI00359E1B0D
MERPQLQRVLADDYLDGLDAWPTADVRAARAACEAEEEAVSYARRLTQGRLDILRDELERRHAGDGDGRGGDHRAGDVLARLPAILAADQPPSDPARARATRLRVPAGAEAYEAEIEALVGEGFLGDLPGRSTDEVADAVERLAAYEHELSTARRRLFERIDRLRDELARRYKDGSAAVRDLFGDT